MASVPCRTSELPPAVVSPTSSARVHTTLPAPTASAKPSKSSRALVGRDDADLQLAGAAALAHDEVAQQAVCARRS